MCVYILFLLEKSKQSCCWLVGVWLGMVALPLQCMPLEEKAITIITPNLDCAQFELWPRMRDTGTFALYRFFFFLFFFNLII